MKKQYICCWYVISNTPSGEIAYNFYIRFTDEAIKENKLKSKIKKIFWVTVPGHLPIPKEGLEDMRNNPEPLIMSILELKNEDGETIK